MREIPRLVHIPAKNLPIKTSGDLPCLLDISGARWGKVVLFLRAINKANEGGPRIGQGRQVAG